MWKQLWNKTKVFLVMAIVTIGVTSCTGCKERVMPGHVAKVLTVNGWEAGTAQPGYVDCWGRDKIVLLEVTTQRQVEKLSVKMKDDLDLPFDVYVRMRIQADKIDGMFADIKPNWDAGNPVQGTISFDTVYNTYGQMLVRNIARTVMTQYSVADVKSNIKLITSQLHAELTKAFATIPLTLEDVTLSGFKYPEVITRAYEIKAEREIEIQQIEAEKAKDIAAKEAELVIVSKQREIDLLKANTMRDYNKIIGDGISESWVLHRHYEVLEKMAENKNSVFMPYEAYRPNNAGLHMEMFKKVN